MEDDFDSGAQRGADDRPRGVPKAKLDGIDLGPKLAIFYRPHRHAPMIPLENSYPREAVKIFCDHFKDDIKEDSVRSLVITGGELSAYKMILNWIKDCIESQSIEKFPDIPEPENDPFTPTINIIIAGEHLGIPAGSLGYHLKKRLNGCARKNLMPFHQVRDLYDMKSDTYEAELKNIACTSIFNAWWDARLDESQNPELMEELSDMRDDIKELDDDLHRACAEREEQVRQKWAEKKMKKKNVEQSSGADDGWGNTETNDTTADGSWDSAAPAASGTGGWDTPENGLTQGRNLVSGDWAKENIDPAGGDIFDDWSKPQNTIDNECAIIDDDDSTGNNWADEMNDTTQKAPYTSPQVQW